MIEEVMPYLLGWESLVLHPWRESDNLAPLQMIPRSGPKGVVGKGSPAVPTMRGCPSGWQAGHKALVP